MNKIVLWPMADNVCTYALSFSISKSYAFYEISFRNIGVKMKDNKLHKKHKI